MCETRDKSGEIAALAPALKAGRTILRGFCQVKNVAFQRNMLKSLAKRRLNIVRPRARFWAFAAS
jgi:hypothetical protein